MPDALHRAVEIIVPALMALSIAVILLGVVRATVLLVRMEVDLWRGRDCAAHRREIRQHLGYYILLALEFLIAVDVIESLEKPSLEQLAILGGVVVIRLVTGYGLQAELAREARE